MFLRLIVQGACRSVSGIFPGVPDSHFDSTPLQRFYIQLTLGFFLVDSIHVRAPARCVLLLRRVVFERSSPFSSNMNGRALLMRTHPLSSYRMFALGARGGLLEWRPLLCPPSCVLNSISAIMWCSYCLNNMFHSARAGLEDQGVRDDGDSPHHLPAHLRQRPVHHLPSFRPLFHGGSAGERGLCIRLCLPLLR